MPLLPLGAALLLLSFMPTEALFQEQTLPITIDHPTETDLKFYDIRGLALAGSVREDTVYFSASRYYPTPYSDQIFRYNLQTNNVSLLYPQLEDTTTVLSTVRALVISSDAATLFFVELPVAIYAPEAKVLFAFHCYVYDICDSSMTRFVGHVCNCFPLYWSLLLRCRSPSPLSCSFLVWCHGLNVNSHQRSSLLSCLPGF